MIVTLSGAIIDVTNGWRDALQPCDVFAEMLAEHFDAEFLPGQFEERVSILAHSDGSGNTVTFEHSGWALNPVSLIPVIAWAAIAFILFIIYVVIP